MQGIDCCNAYIPTSQHHHGLVELHTEDEDIKYDNLELVFRESERRLTHDSLTNMHKNYFHLQGIHRV
jgi:hypothetical protein